MKIAINGFGRIGRQFFQAAAEKGMLGDIVAINDIGSIENLAYLLKYDSVHKKSELDIKIEKNYFVIKKSILSRKKILFINEKSPENLPWKSLGIDLVIESTGLFTKREEAEKHIKAGAKRVLITAPGNDVDFTLILGVNDKGLRKEHKIISMASCTSNCIVPIAKVLNDKFGIEKGYMVTAHAFTADQRLVDAPHKDFRRGRTASYNIVPTTTGAAKMIGEVIPEMKGKIDGYALRVPVADGSICNLTVFAKKTPSIEEVNQAFLEASRTELRNVLEYSQEPLVSSDIIHNSSSCIFDSLFTTTIGNMINVIGWYDNEWGYSCRLADVSKLIGKLR